MDAGLYIAAQGMLVEQVRQNQLANDLANASTPGYKPDRTTQQDFGSLLLSNTQSGQSIGSLSTGLRVGNIVTDLAPGTLNHTGQPLDFGISGTGFFAVQTAQGVRYTRDGQFSASAQGSLVDAQGNQVLSPSGAPIPVSAQGTVPASALGVFNVTGATKQGYNLYTGTAAGRATGTVQQGALEASSVDAVQTMTDMIASLRAYESGQKAISSIDETLQASAQSVGSLGGG
jgi:flagellar basal-body rod protein FlgG